MNIVDVHSVTHGAITFQEKHLDILYEFSIIPLRYYYKVSNLKYSYIISQFCTSQVQHNLTQGNPF